MFYVISIIYFHTLYTYKNNVSIYKLYKLHNMYSIHYVCLVEIQIDFFTDIIIYIECKIIDRVTMININMQSVSYSRRREK